MKPKVASYSPGRGAAHTWGSESQLPWAVLSLSCQHMAQAGHWALCLPGFCGPRELS
jgi:hypothetical protein